MKMEITLPEGIEHYEPELRLFFDLMIRKLHICRDKGFGENRTATQMFLELNDEVDELEEALRDESQFQTALECVDVANQAWLLALVVLRATRADFEDQRMKASKKEKFEGTEAKTIWFKEVPSPLGMPHVKVKQPPPPLTVPRGYGNKNYVVNPETFEPVEPGHPSKKEYEAKKKAEELEEVQKWYAKQQDVQVEEFDDYDLHVCRVLLSYKQDKLKK